MKPKTLLIFALILSVFTLLFSNCNKEESVNTKELKAFFIADTLSGESPLMVSFTNQSENAIGYYWLINDDTVANSVDLTYSFENPLTDTGDVIYTVKLIAYNELEESDTHQENVIVALNYEPVKALFSCDRISGYFPLTATFTNQSEHANRYKWLINGDSVSDAVNFKYTFEYNGPKTKKNYTVQLVAYNNYGYAEYDTLINPKKRILCDNPKLTTIDKKIDSLMMKHFDDWQLCGASLAIVDGETVSTYHYGETQHQNGVIPNNETMYQIASITKPFTGISTIYWLNQNNTSIDASVADYLPDSCAYGLAYEGTQASFRHLLSHTSGLPRNDLKMPNAYTEDPYFGYDSLGAYSYLANNTLLRKPGTVPNESTFETFYSNYAFGLLGFILERQINKPLQQIFEEIIMNPAGMEEATVDDIEQFQNRAYPNRKGASPVYWHHNGIKGCTALNCNIDDLVQYVTWIISLDESTEVGKAVYNSFQVQYPYINVPPFKSTGLALPWFIYEPSGGGVIRGHSGSTFGMVSMMDIDIQNKKSLILFMNNAPQDLTESSLYVDLYDIVFGTFD